MRREKTFRVFTFGCKVNQYESQIIREQLVNSGFRESTDDPFICVINSCAVTAVAERKCRAFIRSVLRKYPNSRVVLAGCYAQLIKREKIRFPGRLISVPQDKKQSLIEELKLSGLIPEDSVKEKNWQAGGIRAFSGHARAFVKIQDGCDNFCAYCIVPHLRGRPLSKPAEVIKEEIMRLSEKGFREIVLTGINLGSWGRDLKGGHRLPFLLKKLCLLKGLGRLRLSSLEPEFVDNELIALIRDEQKICPHLHVPLQNGDDFVLKMMNRRYTAADYLRLVKNARNSIKDLAMSTDIIVGFPGEEDKHFQNTLSLVREAGFLRVHIFPYSARTGTPAAKFRGQVAAEVKKQRKHILEETVRKSGFAFRRRFLGRELRVLYEERKSGFWQGYADNYIFVKAKSDKDIAGRFIASRLTGVSEKETIAEIL